MSDARWLDREAAARYLSVRVDDLPRLLRAGKIPPPSCHLGPRSPRYDREAIDAVFSRIAPSSMDKATEEAINGIIRDANRKKAQSMSAKRAASSPRT